MGIMPWCSWCACGALSCEDKAAYRCGTYCIVTVSWVCQVTTAVSLSRFGVSKTEHRPSTLHTALVGTYSTASRPTTRPSALPPPGAVLQDAAYRLQLIQGYTVPRKFRMSTRLSARRPSRFGCEVPALAIAYKVYVPRPAASRVARPPSPGPATPTRPPPSASLLEI